MTQPETAQYLTPVQLFDKADRLDRRANRARWIAGVSASLAAGATVLFTIATANGERPDLEQLTPTEITLYSSIGLWGVAFAGGFKATHQRGLAKDLNDQALRLNEQAYQHFAIPAEAVQEVLGGQEGFGGETYGDPAAGQPTAQLRPNPNPDGLA